MAETKQCYKCQRITDKIIPMKNGTNLCAWCYQDLFSPMCQYPRCKNRCDHAGNILCEMHYRAFTSENLPSEMQEFFKNKFKEKGISYKIIKRG